MGRSKHEAGKVGRAKLEVVSDAGYPLHRRSDAGLADEARRTAGVGAAFLLCRDLRHHGPDNLRDSDAGVHGRG